MHKFCMCAQSAITPKTLLHARRAMICSERKLEASKAEDTHAVPDFFCLAGFWLSFTANHCAVLHAVPSWSLLLTLHACRHYAQLSNAGQVITCNIIVCSFVLFCTLQYIWCNWTFCLNPWMHIRQRVDIRLEPNFTSSSLTPLHEWPMR